MTTPGAPPPVSPETAMSVHSVRLPDHLWQRLKAMRDEVNNGRPAPVSLSSVMRALLEQALTAGPPDLDARIFRPPRVDRERVAR